MKIKIALIQSEHIAEVQDLSAKLQKAMESGEMKAVDQATGTLLSLTDKEYSLSVSEEYWHQLIEQVRNFDENFKSDFIIEKPQLEMIIAAGFADSFADIINVIEQALKIESVVLQLPYEEESEDV